MIASVRTVPAVVTDLGVGVGVAVLLLAAARFGLGPVGAPAARGVDLAAVGLGALFAGFLAVRRRYPLTVLIALNAVTLTWFLADYPGRLAAFAPMIGLYTVAAHRGWRWGLAAATVTGLTMVLIGLTGVPVVGAPPPNPELVLTAYAAGTAVRYRGELVSAIRSRLAREAQARAEQARRLAVEQRLRIAREVHDIVGHALATISVQAGVAIHVMEQRPAQALDALTAIKKISDEGLADIKSVLTTLLTDSGDDDTDDDGGQPRTPPAGLDQLNPLLEATTAAGPQIELTLHGTPRPLPAAVDLAAYRIIQESLTNTLRHAAAGTVWLDLDYQPSRLAIRIRDDGSGPVGTTVNGTGRGIAGMRDRAIALAGQLTAGPRVDGGFEVHCVLPTRDRA